MIPLAAIAAAGLLARLAAAAPVAPGGEVEIEGNVHYDVATGRAFIRDGAVVRRGAIVLRSRTATYDPATGEVVAEGNVLLTDATHVVAADRVRAVLGGEMEADGVVAFVKDQPVDLSRAATLSEARRVGRNRLSFSGAHLSGDQTGHFRLTDARLTLCDCGEGHLPSWEVRARGADVIAGYRAILSRAVLRIAPPLLNRSVPVLWLPWLYVPLGERQSGLLLPEFPGVPASEFTVAEPVFVTLGRSADMTLTPAYFFGRSNPTAETGSIRGPGARLELRWAPAVAAAGELHLAWVHDLEREAVGAGGDRFALDLTHAQRASDRTTLAATLRLESDWSWLRDMTPAYPARLAPYRRSDVAASHRGDGVVIEGGASYLQPLEPLGPPVNQVAGWYGPLGSRLDVASRWPDAALSLLPVAAGPLQLSGRAGVARFAPVSGAHDFVGRPAADRADARLEIAAPLAVGDVLSLAPYARGAGTAYTFESSEAQRANGWGVAGAIVSTEVSRRWGTLRHAISPRVEWRMGWGGSGDALPWAAYDAFDRSDTSVLSATPGPFQQLRAAVETRLLRDGTQLLRLELGQDADLREGRFAETFGSASGSAGPFSADAGARSFWIDPRPPGAPPPSVPSRLDRFSELHANVALVDRRGDALRAGFFSVGPGGSGSLVAGIDPLFDSRPAQIGASRGASVGARIAAGGATFGYDAGIAGPGTGVGLCQGSGQRLVESWKTVQHVGTLAWASPCRCFNLLVSVRVDHCGNVVPSASLDLSRLADATRFH